ncbi:MAG: NUDIX domain-containing protein [Oscillospiraceae bacterium]|nr:NUDIX domain-containing protein [Oscillospiraceae bacterium]
MSDVLFKMSDSIFSYRVGGILIKNGNVLLQKPRNDEYSIIGGHVKMFETAEDTLVREFKEELRADIQVGKLVAIGEVFWQWGNRACHQVCLYFNVELKYNTIPTEGVFHGYDEFNNERVDLDFCWIPLSDIQQGIKVYPIEFFEKYSKNPTEVIRFVSNQLE